MSSITASIRSRGKLNGDSRSNLGIQEVDLGTTNQRLICIRNQWDGTHNTLDRCKSKWSRQNNNRWTREMIAGLKENDGTFNLYGF